MVMTPLDTVPAAMALIRGMSAFTSLASLPDSSSRPLRVPVFGAGTA